MRVRRAADRPVTEGPGTWSRHAFSFGRHYDPDDTGLGVLVACNDERVAPGAGFPAHPHRDVLLVTWVLEGVLRSAVEGVDPVRLGRGGVQVTVAGTGLVHAETADGPAPLRFVQSWLVPPAPGLPPVGARADRDGDLAGGGFVTVASGLGHPGALALPQAAALHVARPAAGGRLVLPRSPLGHLLVARGAVTAGGTALAEGDAVHLHDEAVPVQAGPAGTELLLWELAPG